jgi:ribosomal protein S18 acetylase RimI-like enzyme
VNIEVRPVRREEIAEAGRVTRDAYVEHAPRDGSWDGYLERLADVGSRAATATVLVAVVDGVVAGTATLELHERIPGSDQPPLADDEAHLRMVAVDPAKRRLGIGRRLVDTCVAIARRAGKRRLTLDTTEQMQAARAMYESMGFRFSGTTDRVPTVCMLMYELNLAETS